MNSNEETKQVVVNPECKPHVTTPADIFQIVCPGCPWEKDKSKPCHLCR